MLDAPRIANLRLRCHMRMHPFVVGMDEKQCPIELDLMGLEQISVGCLWCGSSGEPRVPYPALQYAISGLWGVGAS